MNAKDANLQEVYLELSHFVFIRVDSRPNSDLRLSA